MAKVKLQVPELTESRARSWLTAPQREAFAAVKAINSNAACAKLGVYRKTIRKRVQKGIEAVQLMERQMKL